VDLRGELVGNYRILRLIGEGGMGYVYEAVHPVLGRRAAIKILKLGSEIQRAGRVVERFFNEARLVASLGHPNIIEAFDFGEVAVGGMRSYYVIMELLEGESLGAALRRGPLPLDVVLVVGAQAAAGLGAAHRRGVVHRDVKPDNLFLARRSDGREVVKILDFGIAKPTGDGVPLGPGLTHSGALVGTPSFMSPEHCAGHAVDARSDIYCLGLVLYQAITGQPPFIRETPPEIMVAQVRDAPRRLTEIRPDVPPPLEAAVLCALAKRPEHRFASMADFAAALSVVATVAAPSAGEHDFGTLMDACQATRLLAEAPARSMTLPIVVGAPPDAATHTAGAATVLPSAAQPPSATSAPPALEPGAPSEAPVVRSTLPLAGLVPGSGRETPARGLATPAPAPPPPPPRARRGLVLLLVPGVAAAVIGGGFLGLRSLRRSPSVPQPPVVVQPPTAPVGNPALAQGGAAPAAVAGAPAAATASATAPAASAPSFAAPAAAAPQPAVGEAIPAPRKPTAVKPKSEGAVPLPAAKAAPAKPRPPAPSSRDRRAPRRDEDIVRHLE
jgi:serine/threonine-protein kinase